MFTKLQRLETETSRDEHLHGETGGRRDLLTIKNPASNATAGVAATSKDGKKLVAKEKKDGAAKEHCMDERWAVDEVGYEGDDEADDESEDNSKGRKLSHRYRGGDARRL
ncbi:hypothetical protein VTL71DRAFT_12977 [Oculimacula yallundae]|uniref:Uncharacterized protein n=1 Tax=Oculimacula yallundae TaxID=86028 RepID=A0ABR4CPN1_9HELO